MSGQFGRMTRARLRALSFAAAVCFTVPSAFADPSGEAGSPFEEREEGAEAEVDPLQRARESFLEGRRLMGEEAWEEAAAAFQDALAAMPTPGLHYYLGVCLEQQGDPLAARKAYLESRALLERHPAADVAALLPAAFKRVEAKLGRLEILLTPDDGIVRVDGSTWTEARAPWLVPGPHVLYAEAPGYEPVHLHFEVTAGALTQLRVKLPLRVEEPAPPLARAPAVPPPAPPPMEEPTPPPRLLPPTAFWGSVAFGAIGAGVGVAGVFWHLDASAQVARAQEEIDGSGAIDSSACYRPTTGEDDPCEHLRAAVSQEESATMLIVGGFAAAGLGALGAVASWIAWPNEKFAIRGRVGFGRAELQLRGRF